MPGVCGSGDSVALVCYVTASSLAKGPVLWMSVMLSKPCLGQLCSLALVVQQIGLSMIPVVLLQEFSLVSSFLLLIGWTCQLPVGQLGNMACLPEIKVSASQAAVVAWGNSYCV